MSELKLKANRQLFNQDHARSLKNGTKPQYATEQYLDSQYASETKY